MRTEGLRAIFSNSELKKVVCQAFPTCNGVVVDCYNEDAVIAYIRKDFPNYCIERKGGNLLVTISHANTGCPRCGYHLVWIRVIYDYDGKATQHEAIIAGTVHQMRTEVKCQACGCTISKPVAGHEEIKPNVTLGSTGHINNL